MAGVTILPGPLKLARCLRQPVCCRVVLSGTLALSLSTAAYSQAVRPVGPLIHYRIPINIHPNPPPLPPIPPIDLTPGPAPIPVPIGELRGTLTPLGGSMTHSSTPKIMQKTSEGETVSDTPQVVSEPSISDPAAEVREAQARGVSLHLGGEPPHGDRDDDEDETEEGTNWWLWLLLAAAVVLISAQMRKR